MTAAGTGRARGIGYVRSAGAAVAAVVAVAGCTPGPATPQARTVERVSVLTGFNITGQDAYLYVGIDKGIFRAAGLEVSVQAGAGTGSNLKLLRAGQVGFAVLDLTGLLIELKDQPSDVRVFTAIYQRSVSCIMAPAARGITGPKDLEGRQVGYSPGGVNFTLFPTYARLAGIDAGKVRWVALPPPNLRPAMIAGRLDAITEIVIGRPAVELAAGAPMTVLPYSDYLGDLYGNAMATRLDTAMGNPQLVGRFRDAMLQALAYTIDHPDEAGAILARHQPAYNPEAAAAEIRAAEPYIRSTGAGQPIGAIQDQRVMRSIALLQAAGAIPASGRQPGDILSPHLTPPAPGR